MGEEKKPEDTPKEVKNEKKNEQKKTNEKTEKPAQPAQENKKKTEKGKKPNLPKSPEEKLLEEFAKLELRVGKIEEVWKHPESEKLWCEKINIGLPAQRQIASGLQKHVSIDEMKIGLCMVATNLKPKKLANFPSEGMVMCASIKTNPEEEKIELVHPEEGTSIGDYVSFPKVAAGGAGGEMSKRQMKKANKKEGK